MVETQTSQPHFQIQVARPGEVRPEGLRKDVVDGTAEHFKKVGEVAALGAESVAELFDRLAVKPKSLALDFGVTVGGEAGIPLVTKGKIDANFSVTITWEAPESK